MENSGIKQMARIDLGEGNKFIITKTHEEIATLLEEIRGLEEKYPAFEIKEIKLPESEEKDALLDIEKTEPKTKKTKKRIRIKRKTKKQPEKTFSDDGPEFIELENEQKQNITEITKEPEQTVYENLTEWEEVQPEKTIQTETTIEKPDNLEIETSTPTEEIEPEVSEIKKHRVRIIPSTNIKLIIDEEGNLVMADKPKTIIKKKIKTETEKEEKTKKTRKIRFKTINLKKVIPNKNKKEETKE